MTKSHFAVCLLAVCLLTAAAPAAACGPYPFDTRFWFDHRPGVAEHRVVRGELGVFAPQYDTEWIFSAWRQLAGPGLVESDREKLVWLLVEGLGPDEPPGDGTEPWLEARQEIATDGPGWLDPNRESVSGDGEGDGETRTWNWFANCLPDAFATAAATLRARAAEYGADDPWVQEWLRGQDAVFDNCDDGVVEPDPASADWPAWLQQDRAYQRAAAALYSERYDLAAERFAEVADDPDSAWRSVSAYLVGRAQARADRYDDAIATYRSVLDDPAAEAYHASARGLVDHLLFRHDPDALRREVTQRLSATPLTESLRQDLIDFRRLAAERAHEDDAVDALTDWFRAVQGWSSPGHVVERWRSETNGSHAAAWRWAALLRANATEIVFDDGREYPPLDAETIEELLAAPTLEPGDTGAVSEAYHRARLLLDLGRTDEAVLILERAIEGWYGSVATAETNLFMAQRLRAAKSLDEVVRFGQMVPAEAGWNYGSEHEPLDPPQEPVATWDGGQLWHYAAATALNGLGPSPLASLVTDETVDDDLLAAETLRTAWTRAVVLGDAPATVELARRVARADGRLAPALADLETASGEELPFVATLVLLRHPGLHPDVHWGVSRTSPLDELESGSLNWWCEGGGFDLPDAETRARLGLGDGADGDVGHRLEQLPSAPNWMGDVVLAYADGHPDDPRVPEALHRVVHATRYGCKWGERSVAEVSKGAFERLHRRYPGNAWTEKTPYWFD